MLDKELKTPKTLSSHITITINTTMLSMFLIFESIGIYLFTSHRRKPTTMRIIRMLIKGIDLCIKNMRKNSLSNICKHYITLVIFYIIPTSNLKLRNPAL